jgi:uncharacterized protein YxeA
MKKWIAVIVIIIIAIIGYNYVYQDHRNINAELPIFAITANAISNEFVTNSRNSEKKYLNKTVEITGTISESGVSELTLDHMVFCQLKQNLKSPIKKGSKIKIKGRIIGYDDLLEQVKMDQCSIIN